MTTFTPALPERNTSADGSIVVRYEDRRHAYFIEKPDLGRVPSVTTIIGCYDKPALPPAAAKVTLEGVAALARQEGIVLDHFKNAYKLGDALYQRGLKYQQVWKRKADRGTFVHAVNQAWIEDGRIPTADDVPDDYRQYVQAFGNWVIAHRPAFLLSEVIVASIVWKYAGRYDAKGIVTTECNDRGCACHANIGKVGRWDWKTSPSLYPENASQLDLYEVAAIEMGEAEAHYRAPLQLGADGSFTFRESRLPLGTATGLVAGYRAQQTNAELHKDWGARRKGVRRG